MNRVTYYHEAGAIFRVEVLDEKETKYGKTKGLEYKLKVLGIVDSNGFEPPKVGSEFSVWRAYDSTGYASWSLVDD